MDTLKFILQPYKGAETRFTCPQCKKSGSLVRYINPETGECLSPEVGRCNREAKCQYHYTPKQFFQDNPYKLQVSSMSYPFKSDSNLNKIPLNIPATYISKEIFNQSLSRYKTNNFVTFLSNIYGKELAKKAIDKYYIGTSKHWSGSTVFWQVDHFGQIRTGKIMLYDSESGHRIKEPFNHIAWAHKALKLPDFNLKQCLFGEHQIKHTVLPVAIVESEKTAIISSLYLPQFTWLACGSLNNLSLEKCQALKGRKIILFPDLNGYDKWMAKASELKVLGPIIVSDLLERNGIITEREQGLDLADYLLRFNLDDFKG